MYDWNGTRLDRIGNFAKDGAILNHRLEGLGELGVEQGLKPVLDLSLGLSVIVQHEEYHSDSKVELTCRISEP